MNVLFLTLVQFNSLKERGIYTDLLREFVKNGHQVYAISPMEKRQNEKTCLIKEEDTVILRLRIGNIQKTNFIEKGISTVMLESAFKKAIRRYFFNVKFDLVLYSTPPITMESAINYVKKRDGAKTYLLLKDIFPQNAVDIGIMSKKGLRGLLYWHFRNQEKRLYRISDRIGCMSPENVKYVVAHNPEVDSAIVEECPNSIEVVDKSVDSETRKTIRQKYGIPLNKKVFVYGGNLGKPQGIPFLIECIEKCKDIDDVCFLVVGDGTEYGLVEEYTRSNQRNVMLMKHLPKEDYDTMVGACDVGLIFLDHRFTIPNFPSRLLTYMQAKLPIFACTDSNTDIGKIIINGGFGWWVESDDVDKVRNCIEKILSEDLIEKGNKGFLYEKAHYSIHKTYETIIACV